MITRRKIDVMRIDAWWPRLTDESRNWLMDHNGEPLDPSVKRDVLDVNDGNVDPSWWAGESTEGQSELTDEAIDWIEAVANGAPPTA
ncbi:hypothetical protein [Aldersonia kunmingensis]|uniref:hypothetical protein n=1 Tax=Aldersonia kunmingensis TaxID=408066 RepID=UPI001FE1F250|nr:hypothetical protein [Aldersonia kunmingensis]